MSEQPSPAGEPNSNDPNAPTTQRYSHSAVAARVPERVAKGVFTTGQVVLDSPKEFIIDFLQGLTRPHQVVARVVLAPATMFELVQAMRQNLENYTKVFGAPPPLPPPGPNRPTLQEIYENFKLPDDMLSGNYANAVLIGHSPSEFFFDFITTFYPTAGVSVRVFLPAVQAPRFLSAIENATKQFQARHGTPPGLPPQTPPSE